MSLSPRVEKTKSQEVNKRFVPEQRRVVSVSYSACMCIYYNNPNEEYENLVNDHMEAAVECIQTKPRAEYIVQRETLEVRNKQDNVKRVFFV